MKKILSPGILVIIIMIVITVNMNSCYYDKEELLYSSNCDTAVVTYRQTIVPILSSSCNGCHGGTTPSANVRLDNYAGVRVVATNGINGKLWGAVSHTSAFPMPKNAPKLNNCNLAKIRKWLEAGYPDN